MKYEELIGLFGFLNRAYKHQVPYSEWLGMPVYTDESVEPGKAELRDEKGHVIAIYELPE